MEIGFSAVRVQAMHASMREGERDLSGTWGVALAGWYAPLSTFLRARLALK